MANVENLELNQDELIMQQQRQIEREVRILMINSNCTNETLNISVVVALSCRTLDMCLKQIPFG